MEVMKRNILSTFVLLLLLYFSLRISALTTQVKNLAQQLALLQPHPPADR